MESSARLSKTQKSVTLLELVIVSAIIAILANQAILYFFGITAGAKLSEAKLILKQIDEMQGPTISNTTPTGARTSRPSLPNPTTSPASE